MRNVILIYALLIAVCTACSNDSFVVNENIGSHFSNPREKVIYTSSKARTRSMAADAVGEWETWETVTLNSGNKVYTPWNSMSATAIPQDIREDIKYANGWRLIAHTLTGKDNGLNYLIFHNIYSGILKGYYYWENSSPQNNGIWEIHFCQPHSASTFCDQYSKLSSDRNSINFYIGNITNDDNKAFAQGWNCFQTELAYDPNLKYTTMQIIPSNNNTGRISLSGDIVSETDGSVISTITTNSLTNGVKGMVLLIQSSKIYSQQERNLQIH